MSWRRRIAAFSARSLRGFAAETIAEFPAAAIAISLVSRYLDLGSTGSQGGVRGEYLFERSKK
jgi:hypothetical protein